MTTLSRRRWLTAVAAVVVAGAAVAVALVVTRGDPPSRTPAADDAGPPAAAPSGQVSPGEDVAFAALLAASEADLPKFQDGEVSATAVSVLAPVGPSTVWVGSGGRRVLVVFVSAEDAESLTPGTRVSFTGHVRQADPGFGEALGLAGEDEKAFERHRMYVEAEGYTRA